MTSAARRGRIELTVGLCVLAVIVGVGAGLALRRNTPVDPGLALAPAALDFGTVWEQPALRHTLTVTNPTDAPIRVAGIKTGCGCTTVAPQRFTVPPGGRQELTATLNLTDRAGGSEPRPFSVDLLPTLAHQPPDGRTVWTLKGDVRPNPIGLSEPAVDFGDGVIVGQPPPTREIEVTLAEESPFDGLRAVGLDKAGRVELRKAGPRRWRLTVTPPAGLPPGPFAFAVRVEAIAEDQLPVPFRKIAVAGTVRHDIAAWPAAVRLGAIEVGEAGEEYVVLASHAGRPFEVTRIEAPEGVTVEPAADQVGDGSRTFVVTATAKQRDGRKNRITFHVRRPDPPPGGSADLTIPLEVSYYGTAAGP